MKVLHVIPSVSDVRGGPSKAVIEMTYSLCQKNIDVEIATTNDDGEGFLDVPFDDLTLYKNVPIRFFKKDLTLHPSLREFTFSYSFSRWLVKNIENYDLIHVHAIFSYVSTFSMWLARKKNIPYIVRPLGQLCNWSLKQSSTKKNIYLNIIEYANLMHSSLIHYTSNLEQNEAQRLGFSREKSFVLPHGLEFEDEIPDARKELRKKFNIANHEFIILFMSRIHPKKGISILLNALNEIQEENFCFLIAGTGDQKYELEVNQTIDNLGLRNRTKCLGFMSGVDKRLLLQGSDLFVLTSYSENFGIAVLEALASGLATVVSPYVALSSILEEHQIGKVVPLDKTDIASTIKNMIRNTKSTHLLGEKARQFVIENYSWETITNNLLEKYNISVNKI